MDTTVLVTLIGSVAGIIVAIIKFKPKKKDNVNFDQGKLQTEITHFKEELGRITNTLNDMDDDIQKNHLQYDSIQRQIADIRVSIARLEGTR